MLFTADSTAIRKTGSSYTGCTHTVTLGPETGSTSVRTFAVFSASQQLIQASLTADVIIAKHDAIRPTTISHAASETGLQGARVDTNVRYILANSLSNLQNTCTICRCILTQTKNTKNNAVFLFLKSIYYFFRFWFREVRRLFSAH